jgi:hypothetical protein
MRCNAHEVRAREIHVYEVHTHAMRACEVHAHEIHAYEVNGHKVYAHKVHAHEMHAWEPVSQRAKQPEFDWLAGNWSQHGNGWRGERMAGAVEPRLILTGRG